MSDAHQSTTDSAALQLMAEIDAAILGDSASQDVAIDLSTPERELGEGKELFARLYVSYRPAVASQVRRYLNDARDVDEVVQETFLRLLLALPDLQTDGQVIAWCRRTATNMCIDRYRAAGRRPRLSPLDEMPAGFDAVYDTDPVTLAEDASIVREALARLSPLHRQALIMREVEEKTLPEIAAALSIPESTVKHVLHRARKSMRRLLADTPVARVTAGFVVVLVAVASSLFGLRPGHPAPPQISALPNPQVELKDLLPDLHSRLAPTHEAIKKVAAAEPAQAVALAPSVLAAPVSSAIIVTPTAPVVAQSIDNSPFTYRDPAKGVATLAHAGQSVSWLDSDDGQDVVHAYSEVDVANIGAFFLSFSRAADTTSSASASPNLLINGKMVALQVVNAVSSVQPQSDGSFLVALDETLTGKDTDGHQVMAPRRLLIATRYAADLGKLVSSRLELSKYGNT